MFFAVGIPFFSLTVLGFQTIGSNQVYRNIANIFCCYGGFQLHLVIGVKQASAFAQTEGDSVKKNICCCQLIRYTLNSNTILLCKEHDRDGFKIAQDPAGNEALYLMMLV
jgi:hypothetical protein